MKLAYVAFDRAGAQVNHTLDAASVHEAREILRRQGLFVTSIEPAPVRGSSSVGEAVGPPAAHGADGISVRKWSVPAGKNRRLRQLTSFMRQLHVLVVSGTPLVQALSALERQASDGEWRSVIEEIRQRVEEGVPLSIAMQHHPRYFDPICRSLITAGESSGKLEPMLERLAKLTRKQLHLRSSIRGAMIYPCLLILVALTVMIVLLTFVLPRFADMFETLDAPLPPTTQFIMNCSDLVLAYWWALLIGLAGVAAGAFRWFSTAGGRLAVDAVVLRLPVFGAIVKNFATARITRLLGVQLEGKVPLLEALHLTRLAAGNAAFAALVERAEDAAERGQSISASFADSSLVPPTVTEAMRSGEATGQMASLLLSIADFLDEENEVTVRSLTSIVEPIILIIMGVCVGFVAISLFLPLFDLTSMATQGGAQ